MVWTALYRWIYWIKDVEDEGARKAVGAYCRAQPSGLTTANMSLV